MKKRGILAVLCFFSSSSFSAQYLCSTNMQYVFTGDTMESVIAACGTPTQVVQQSAQNPVATAGGNIIWFYQTNESNQTAVSNNGFTAAAGALASPASTINVGPRQINISTSRPPPINLGVVFYNGQVTSIQKPVPTGTLGLQSNNGAGQEVSSYTCANGTIQVGSTMNDVTNACGLPVLQKNMGQAAAQAQTATASPTTWVVYKAQSYLPPQTFIFQNGLLVGQK